MGLDDDDLIGLEQLIAADPTAAPIMRGTGGLRKVRFAPEGRGKSGGFRVCYFFHAAPGMVVLARVFSKSAKANISAAERSIIRRLAAEIDREFNPE